ncbi:MAG: hypothetical protein V8R50_04195 [Clostridia bacterium]
MKRDMQAILVYFSELMCYLDLRKEPFEPGQLYVIKLIVKDKAGNSAEKTMEFAVPVESLLPRVIPAQLEIDKTILSAGARFIVGPEQTRMKLKGNVTGAVWYLANYKTDPDLKDENGNPIYEDYWWNDVLALVKEANDGTRKYTVDRVENGLKQDIQLQR